MLMLFFFACFSRYPPHWLDAGELYRAMLPHDEATGKSRGWHLLRRRKQQLSFLHFPGHISSDLWYDFVARVKQTGCDKQKLLDLLIELAKDPKYESVFPSLVPVRKRKQGEQKEEKTKTFFLCVDGANRVLRKSAGI